MVMSAEATSQNIYSSSTTLHLVVFERRELLGACLLDLRVFSLVARLLVA
jgi:hypothetical protein